MKTFAVSSNITSYFSTLKGKLGIFAFNFKPYENSSLSNRSFSSSLNARKFKQYFKNSPYLPFIIIFIIILIIGFFAIKNIFGQHSSSDTATTIDPRISLEKPLATQTINKEFDFPIRDSNQKQVSTIKYEVQGAELRDQIVVKGQKATAVQGKQFLIINLKITNNYSQSINLTTRNYIRLIVNNSTDRLAPDIHNDPVEVQAISTKYSRVGFAINDTDKNLLLQVGEISGSKQTIKLTVK